MAAKFEISKDHAGKFRFHLKAPNGEIIAASHIKTHAPNAKVEDHMLEAAKAMQCKVI
jgi:uncharacterized protein YegP (UPF0339 family)